jgi:predicted O-methyltransferase YrrM
MQLRRTHPLIPAGDLPFLSDGQLSRDIASAYDRAQTTERAARHPDSNPYALLPDTLSFLHELLEETRPKNIFEFGSGLSTLTFSVWSAGHGASLTSVENDMEWIKKLEGELAAGDASASFVHSPLSLKVCRGLTFLTYRDLDTFGPRIKEADLVFLDGPHASGREPALYLALASCKVGATIVLDDFNLYFVRDMLAGVPAELAAGFAGTAIEGNSHGLYVLRSVKPARTVPIPAMNATRVAQSYWRTLNDFIKYEL